MLYREATCIAVIFQIALHVSSCPYSEHVVKPGGSGGDVGVGGGNDGGVDVSIGGNGGGGSGDAVSSNSASQTICDVVNNHAHPAWTHQLH